MDIHTVLTKRSSTFAVPNDVWIQPPLSDTLASTRRAQVEPDLVGALVPHAASPESLRLLDFVYQRLPMNQPRVTVLCLSTCHAPLPDTIDAALPPFNRVCLPGGKTVHIDTRVRKQLATVAGVQVCTTAEYEREHSWRVQVAAIVRAHPTSSVRIVPVLVRRHTVGLSRTVYQMCERITFKTEKQPSSRILLVANSDLLHCGAEIPNWPPCPLSPPAADRETVKAIVQASTMRTRRSRKRQGRVTTSKSFPSLTSTSACGTAVIRTFIAVAQRHRAHWRLAHVRYTCCCTPPNGTRHHVGYPCITFRDPRRWRVPLARLPRLLVERHLFDYSSEHYVALPTLQRLARSYTCLPAPASRAPFVTLYTASDHRLRGCIGTFTPHTPAKLPSTVATYTMQAACHDTRFSPLRIDERDSLTYELHLNHAPTNIWCRSMCTSMTNTDESLYTAVRTHIIVGTHGVTLTLCDNRQATFLASVLPESFACVRGKHITPKQWAHIKQALHDKAGSTSPVKTVSMYVCETLYDSDQRASTHPP